MRTRVKRCIPMLSLVLALGGIAAARSAVGARPAAPTAREKALKEVTVAYDRDVKTILGRKCFDCHSRFRQYPWYHRLPLVKNLIDADIRGAMKNIDMSDGFPFQGRGTPEGMLQAVADEVRDDGMPPWNYRLLHRGSGLSPEEKKKVQAWIDESLKKFESSSGTKSGGNK